MEHKKECRCLFCKVKRGELVKEFHPCWKGGFKNNLPSCIDCGKKLTRKDAKRCQKHAKIGHIGNSSNGDKNGMYGKKHSEKSRDKMIQTRLSRNHPFKQNKVEKKLENILNKLYPDIYKFTGDGYTFIGGFVPDFIDFKNKKIIELFGDYWHRNTQERDKLRLETYKKYDYNTLVIWVRELDAPKRLKKKLIRFNKN